MSDSNNSPLPAVSAQQLEEAARILERIIEDRSLLLQLSDQQQTSFLRATAQVAFPSRTEKRQLLRASRAQRRQQQAAQKQRDEKLLSQTGIRALPTARRLGAAAPAPAESPRPVLTPPQGLASAEFIATLHTPRNCYVCKLDFDRVHFFYDALCPSCATYNWSKRQQTTDLRGRYALLTGGRVKIGFEAALKLLRAGAQLIVTTRFPKDAASRFAAQQDSPQWLEHLQVYGLDLRHTRSVEAFADHLAESLPRLDFILSNACQTVRRPTGFYEHLMEEERKSPTDLPKLLQRVLEGYHQLVADQRLPRLENDAPLTNASMTLEPRWPVKQSWVSGGQHIGIQRAAELSQLALLAEDAAGGEDVFPEGSYDRDLQQLDLRGVNSWRLKLADVSTVELLEVQLVNAVAPFVLNARLKSLMERVPSQDKHIVNVSAMEGVFYRAFKRDTHPHTNMAKAALNMMTRTSAADYIRSGIHMNSVDTGWITDEDPREITHRKQTEHGFSPPLDAIDAAARICDPIFSGLNTGQHVWGKFLKDYRVSNW